MKQNLAVTLTSSALLAGGCADAADHRPPATPDLSAPPPAVKAAQFAGMSRAEMKKLLGKIEKTEPPQPKMGAMCYDMAMPPNRMDYICPACGEKTLFTNHVANHWTYELETCRRLFKALPKRHSMTLDESSFCRKCQPGTNAPALNLLMRYDDGTTNRLAGITSQDLRLLDGFLRGKLTVKDAQDAETPLKNQLPRLRHLLGVTNENTKAKP